MRVGKGRALWVRQVIPLEMNDPTSDSLQTCSALQKQVLHYNCTESDFVTEQFCCLTLTPSLCVWEQNQATAQGFCLPSAFVVKHSDCAVSVQLHAHRNYILQYPIVCCHTMLHFLALHI